MPDGEGGEQGNALGDRVFGSVLEGEFDGDEGGMILAFAEVEAEVHFGFFGETGARGGGSWNEQSLDLGAGKELETRGEELAIVFLGEEGFAVGAAFFGEEFRAEAGAILGADFEGGPLVMGGIVPEVVETAILAVWR